MKMKKGLLALLCIVAIMASAIFGTLAYLTDAEAVVNTFSVGKVHLKLDEAPVDENGKETEGDRVHANEYHILPGQTYDKDPTVTVLAGSEKSYVRILMTVYNASAVQAIIDADNDSGNDVKDYANLFGGWENGMWLYEDFTTDSVANTITFEFRYYETVEGKKDGKDADVKLDPLFTEIVVPGYVTKEQLQALENGTFKIELVAHAIQAAGFDNADAAWAAFKSSTN